MKILLFILSLVCFVACVNIQAKANQKYTSSTINKACLNVGYSKIECKKYATQEKEIIFAFKDLAKDITTWTKELFEQVLEKSKKQHQKTS